MEQNKQELAKIIRQKRISSDLTLYMLSEKSGVSPSHIHRIERGERFPSAKSLSKIAQALDLSEIEAFTQAGFLSNTPNQNTDQHNVSKPKLDPYVAQVLGREPVQVQRVVISVLNILKSIACIITQV